jgi:hypothetical protein
VKWLSCLIASGVLCQLTAPFSRAEVCSPNKASFGHHFRDGPDCMSVASVPRSRGGEGIDVGMSFSEVRRL